MALTRPYLKPPHSLSHSHPQHPRKENPSRQIPNPQPPIHPSPPHPLRAAMACSFAAATTVSSAPTPAARPLAAAPQSVSVARSAVATAARPLRLAASRSARATRLVARAGGVVSSPRFLPRLTVLRVCFSPPFYFALTALALVPLLCRMTCRWSGTRLQTSRPRPCSTRSSSTYVHLSLSAQSRVVYVCSGSRTLKCFVLSNCS